MRKSLPALSQGDFFPLATDVSEEVFAYLRRQGEQTVLVVLNFVARQRVDLKVPAPERQRLRFPNVTESITQQEALIQENSDGWTVPVPPRAGAVFPL